MCEGDSNSGMSYSSSIPASLSLCNKDDYAKWKFKMRSYLIHENLWQTITGYGEDDNTLISIKLRNDERALAKICLTVDGTAMTHIRNAKTALEAWQLLQDAYEDKGMGRRLALERKLYRLTLDQFQNIEMYINVVLSTAQDLDDIGKIIDDASVAAILLEGLGPKYEPLVMALENNNKEHWIAAKRVLQYLKGTIDYTLTYRMVGDYLKAYVDADWANCTKDRRSYTGYCFLLAGSPIAWQARKQSTVALSSTEAEYMALAAAAKEACYLKSFVSDITGKSD